jgi:hypothetical protein
MIVANQLIKIREHSHWQFSWQVYFDRKLVQLGHIGQHNRHATIIELVQENMELNSVPRVQRRVARGESTKSPSQAFDVFQCLLQVLSL